MGGDREVGSYDIFREIEMKIETIYTCFLCVCEENTYHIHRQVFIVDVDANKLSVKEFIILKCRKYFIAHLSRHLLISLFFVKSYLNYFHDIINFKFYCYSFLCLPVPKKGGGYRQKIHKKHMWHTISTKNDCQDEFLWLFIHLLIIFYEESTYLSELSLKWRTRNKCVHVKRL